MLKIINSDQFAMEGTNGRFIHCATVTNTQTFKDYIYMIDRTNQKKYVEDFTGCTLKQIESDDEWEEMSEFGRLHDLWPAAIIMD
jgi:hypothetical protein